MLGNDMVNAKQIKTTIKMRETRKKTQVACSKFA